MPVPFVRKMPNGKRVAQTIEREPEVEAKAQAFIDRGGRYLIEIIPAQKPGNSQAVSVHLMAIIDLPGGVEMVADAHCENGPDLPDMVDAVVRRSISNTPAPATADIIPLHKPELIV